MAMMFQLEYPHNKFPHNLFFCIDNKEFTCSYLPPCSGGGEKCRLIHTDDPSRVNLELGPHYNAGDSCREIFSRLFCVCLSALAEARQ